jgi:hypothetical protein
MTISKPHFVRSIAALIGLAASVWFVVTYTHFSHFRFRFEHEGGSLNAINEVLVPYGNWLYVLPLLRCRLASDFFVVVLTPRLHLRSFYRSFGCSRLDLRGFEY